MFNKKNFVLSLKGLVCYGTALYPATSPRKSRCRFVFLGGSAYLEEAEYAQ